MSIQGLQIRQVRNVLQFLAKIGETGLPCSALKTIPECSVIQAVNPWCAQEASC